MKIRCTNLAEFKNTVQRLAKEAKKEHADVLNKNSIKVLIGAKGVKGAVQLTPKATKARIRRDLNRKLTSWALGGGTHQAKLLFMEASKLLVKQGRRLKGMTLKEWNTLVAATAQRIAAARDASRAYLAAGWLNCVRDLGRTRRTDAPAGQQRSIRGVQVKEGGRAAKSYGIGATPNRLRTFAINMAANGPKAEAIVEKALQQGVVNAIADMNKYLKERLERIHKKHSDRRAA